MLATFGLASASGSVAVASALPGPIESLSELDEVVVTAARHSQSSLDYGANISQLDAAEIVAVRHQHLHELLTRVAGVWLSRGSGQESLAAIRSPVLTGAGSCGTVLTLEDGIPTRPAGFCNVNQLLEIDTEQADSIEVTRGPGTSLYGSNAMHGIVNVLMPKPGQQGADNLAFEYGANDFLRLRADFPFHADAPWRANLLYADDGGFRDDAGYRQAKAHVSARSEIFDGEVIAALSLSDLDQETAGFILGEDAYRDPAINRSNPNPEAFREADSQRLYAIWQRSMPGYELDVRPYLRRSSMRFLQHFLPGQPLEENGQHSAGVMAMALFDREPAATTVGVDLEWADTYLRETQDGPTEGSDFLQETRPAGKHYDYEARGLSLAAYVQTDIDLGERVTLSAGLRAEFMQYNYDNRMQDGNTKDDGEPCGFGGCLYTRPADRSDDFSNLSPRLALTYRLSGTSSLYANVARGFRAPQMTELYRLQSGQQTADLEPELIDSVEAGWRRVSPRWSFDASLYAMKKKNSVLRDAEGFNVDDGRSKHRGAELTINALLADNWQLNINGSYAKHTYDFDSVAAQGETFVSGRDIDTAPRWLGSAEVTWTPQSALQFALQWNTIGEYYLDAENRYCYPGHELWNLRGRWQFSRVLSATLRINNVRDEAIADRADFAFNNYRYFPGRGREVFFELAYTAD